MLGALEAKLIAQAAAEHPGEWRADHSAVLSILLASRNSASGLSKPSRETIAAFLGKSLRTIDAVKADLRRWRLIDWKSGGKKKGGLKLSNQYDLRLFTLLSTSAQPQVRNYKCATTSAQVTSAQPGCAGSVVGLSLFEANNEAVLKPDTATQIQKLWKQIRETAYGLVEKEEQEEVIRQAKERGIPYNQHDEYLWTPCQFRFADAFDDAIPVKLLPGKIFLDEPVGRRAPRPGTHGNPQAEQNEARLALEEGLWVFSGLLSDVGCAVIGQPITFEALYVQTESSLKRPLTGVGANPISKEPSAEYYADVRGGYYSDGRIEWMLNPLLDVA